MCNMDIGFFEADPLIVETGNQSRDRVFVYVYVYVPAKNNTG